jgi:hypothetical protein
MFVPFLVQKSFSIPYTFMSQKHLGKQEKSFNGKLYFSVHPADSDKDTCFLVKRHNRSN